MRLKIKIENVKVQTYYTVHNLYQAKHILT